VAVVQRAFSYLKCVIVVQIQCSIRTLHMCKNASGTKQRPKCVPVNSCAVVDIQALTPICIESFREFKPLGRFALRAKGVTCAIGTCDQVLG
jgi:translation elongation factor EF-1alpha